MLDENWVALCEANLSYYFKVIIKNIFLLIRRPDTPPTPTQSPCGAWKTGEGVAGVAVSGYLYAQRQCVGDVVLYISIFFSYLF